MKQFVLDHFIKECSNAEQIVNCHQPTDQADLWIDLKNGRRLGIFIINRAIRIPEIQDRLKQSTKHGIHTLYIIDGRMMPPNNANIEPPHWMSALHIVAQGRVYAYWCEGRKVTIRPIHMEWKWGEAARTTHYGDPVKVKNLRTLFVDCTSKYLDGTFAVADFNEGTFWKKTEQPNEQHFKYTWRQWNNNTNTRQEREKQQEQEQAYDPWEDFARYYSHTYNTYQQQSRQRQQRTAAPRPSSIDQHYRVLGVTVSASFDEIKQAYRRKARENHPDLHPSEQRDTYNARMAAINTAFDEISKRHNDS